MLVGFDAENDLNFRTIFRKSSTRGMITVIEGWAMNGQTDRLREIARASSDEEVRLAGRGRGGGGGHGGAGEVGDPRPALGGPVLGAYGPTAIIDTFDPGAPNESDNPTYNVSNDNNGK